MFNVLGGAEEILRIRTADTETSMAIEALKDSARTEIRKYDNAVCSNSKTAEQKRFFTNSRECYASVVETGYSFLILLRLSMLLPKSIRDMLSVPYDLSNEINLINRNNDISLTGIIGMGEIINKLVGDAKIKLADKPNKPLSSKGGYDFGNDGFSHAEIKPFPRLIPSLKENGSYFIEQAAIRFERKRLSSEQGHYHQFERSHLIICLKEHFRCSLYLLMDTYKTPDNVLAVAYTLERTSVGRIDIVLEIVRHLVDYGILSIA